MTCTRSGRGVSLAELALSVALLATAGLLILSVLPGVVLGTRAVGQRLEATRVAQGTLEEMRASGLTLPAGPRPVVRVGGVDYTPELRILSAGAGPLATRNVEVRVTWKYRGQLKTHTMGATLGGT